MTHDDLTEWRRELLTGSINLSKEIKDAIAAAASKEELDEIGAILDDMEAVGITLRQNANILRDHRRDRLKALVEARDMARHLTGAVCHVARKAKP